ncbi:MAG: hypothetical protein LC104_04215 [Bacteroidales bacterium]|nr:hypothetical protein [Bacteroidales bacterium]
MPTRFTTWAIILFWFSTTGFIVHRDIWPRYMSEGPPPLKLDLVDEATSRVPVRWIITRNGEKLGSLTTELRYVETDDTFWFDNVYRELRLSFPISLAGVDQVMMYVPEAETNIRVTRDGDLREQKLKGTLQFFLGNGQFRLPLGSVAAEATGVVRDGVLESQFRIDPSGGSAIKKSLDPVAVSAGQVLNPMMPVSRLRDIQPGRRWVIRKVDPLAQAVTAGLSQLAKEKSPLGAISGLGTATSSEVVATVRTQPEWLVRRNGATTHCYVIDYRTGPNEAEATTWVSVDGGRVLRQQASWLDTTLRFERED